MKTQTHISFIKSDKGPSIFHAGKRSLSKGGKRKVLETNLNLGNFISGIKGLLSNTIALIIIVLSIIFTYNLYNRFFNKNTAVIGVSKILSSALLAYGLVFAAERDLNVMLTKGTIVFFVSMLIYVVLIVLL